MDQAQFLMFVEEGATKRLLSLEEAFAMMVGARSPQHRRLRCPVGACTRQGRTRAAAACENR